MKLLLILVGVIVTLYLAHRLLLAADDRGWVFYKARFPRVRMLGLLEELADLRAGYVVGYETSEEIRADQAELGEGRREDHR